MKVRLFVSLDIPSETLAKIIDLKDSIYGHDKKIKWETSDKLHITLKFLGDTEKTKIDEIQSVLKEVANNYFTFRCSFTKFGLFYRKSVPKILWIGTELSKNFMNLQAEIETKLVDIGFEKDSRSFKSHLTLLRLRGNEDLNKLETFLKYDFKPIEFNAQKISLIKSDLKPEGSVYTIIKSFKLNKTED